MRVVPIVARIAVAALIVGAARPSRAQTPASELWPSAGAPTAGEAERWSSQGRLEYDSGAYKEAAASFERALQLRVMRPYDAAWNVARAYARLGNRTQTLRWLRHALELGLPDLQRLQDEPAFSRYREDDGFIALTVRRDRQEAARQPFPRRTES